MAWNQPDGGSPNKRRGFLSGLAFGAVAVLAVAGTLLVGIAWGLDLPFDHDIPGDDEDKKIVDCAPVSQRRSVTRTIDPDSGGVIAFNSEPRHRLVVRRKLKGNQHFEITMTDAPGRARGVDITADRKLPGKHWGVLFLDYAGCPIAGETGLSVAVRETSNQAESRGGTLLAEDSTVVGWIRGGSEYILGAN